jgi:Mrp family chromosome partitioning ATPase
MEEEIRAITNGVVEPRRTKPFPDPANNSEETAGGQAREKIDFKSYSMTTSTQLKPGRREIESLELDTISISHRYRALAKPAREIALNLGRVAPHLVALQDPDLWASEQFDGLALKLIAGTAKQVFKRILVASTHQGEGRTSVLLNTAAALARAGKRVLVIDSDLLRPSILRLLGIETEIGLAEAFGRGLPLGAAMLRIQPCGFDVLPTRERVINHVEILGSAPFWEMLELFDSDYDFVLFDSPAMLERPDSTMLMNLADTALIVICPGMTKSAEMAKAIELLSEEDIFGVVLNRIPNHLFDGQPKHW